MKNYLYLLFVFTFVSAFAEENWQSHWHQALDLYHQGIYEEAILEFDQAVTLMSEEDQSRFPYVLVDRAENNYFLKNYTAVLQDTEKALKSEKLTDYERLSCGIRRMSVYYSTGDTDKAVEEYKQYITGSPLLPKSEYSEKK